MGISATSGCAVANLKLLLLGTRLSAQEKAAGFSRNPPAVFSLSGTGRERCPSPEEIAADPGALRRWLNATLKQRGVCYKLVY